MNITSENTMIFAKEFEGKMHYRAGLSRKNKDGAYEKAYIDVKFPKDTEIADRSKINIQKGFLTFYKNKDNKDIFYLVIQEYSVIVELKQQEEEDPFAKFGKRIEEEQQELPLELPF